MHILLCLATVALVSAQGFSITAFSPGSTVDGAQIQAADNGFYTGISGPSTYCPILPSVSCPEVVGTLVASFMEAMAVMVPGGQQIYVSSNGQVKYTQPHSAYVPPGSITGGWHNKTVVSDCLEPSQRGVLDFSDGSDGGGVTLCPDVPAEMRGSGASLVLYVKTGNFNLTNCVDIVGLTLTETIFEYGCWEYL
ncbi:hypothetical protein F5Y19DRAFT_13709 [Xylariaceae sp. FL1651]|nr:hypothetical protein F5Y19DRAFT_13709 [Xylariaceae sp. FL1651]